MKLQCNGAFATVYVELISEKFGKLRNIWLGFLQWRMHIITYDGINVKTEGHRFQ